MSNVDCLPRQSRGGLPWQARDQSWTQNRTGKRSIEPKERAAYVRQVAHAVKPGGHVIVATFGPEGPTKCSGLNVVRYDASALHDEFGASFQLVKHLTESHQTPAGSIQQFTYCYCNLSSGLS